MGNQRVILRWCPSADLVTFLGVRRQCVPRIFKFPIAGSHIKRSKASDLLVTLQRFPAAQNTPNPWGINVCILPAPSPFFFVAKNIGSRHCRSPAPSEMETASSPSLGDLGPLAPTAVFVQQRLSKMVHLVALGRLWHLGYERCLLGMIPIWNMCWLSRYREAKWICCCK